MENLEPSKSATRKRSSVSIMSGGNVTGGKKRKVGRPKSQSTPAAKSKPVSAAKRFLEDGE